jgi:hypothetical protein
MIQRENGRFDAPKIRKGFVGDSIVDEIRKLSLNDPGYDWYLVWFGFRNNELIFWLIRDESEDYNIFSHLLSSKMRVYYSFQKEFNQIIDIIEKKLNHVSFGNKI